LLEEKLKKLKHVLSILNKEVFGEVKKRKKQLLTEKIGEIDTRMLKLKLIILKEKRRKNS